MTAGHLAYAKLMAAAGHRVVETASTWWYEAHPRWFLSVPIHQELEPTVNEIASVFAAGAWAVRFPCALGLGPTTYRSVCDDPGYDLSTLGSTARRATRRGLERCTVRRVDFQELPAIGGLDISRSTLQRQHRAVPGDHDLYWGRLFAAAATIDDVECWGAFTDGELGAFVIAVTVGSSYYLLVLKSDTDLLPQYPNNALVYTVTQEALRRRHITEVSWGLEPLMANLDGLERFKTGMGFQERPIGQRLEVKPWVAGLLRGPAAWTLARLGSRPHAGQNLSRAAAVVRLREEQSRLPPWGRESA